jgi:hypothetical protein
MPRLVPAAVLFSAVIPSPAGAWLLYEGLGRSVCAGAMCDGLRVGGTLVGRLCCVVLGCTDAGSVVGGIAQGLSWGREVGMGARVLSGCVCGGSVVCSEDTLGGVRVGGCGWMVVVVVR